MRVWHLMKRSSTPGPLGAQMPPRPSRVYLAGSEIPAVAQRICRSTHNHACQHVTTRVNTPRQVSTHHHACQHTTTSVNILPRVSTHNDKCQHTTTSVNTPPRLSSFSGSDLAPLTDLQSCSEWTEKVISPIFDKPYLEKSLNHMSDLLKTGTSDTDLLRSSH